MKNRNPHGICTWDDNSDCDQCVNHMRLHCKWDRKILGGFLLLALPYMFVAILGLVLTGVLTGVWWMLGAYIAFMLFFFTVFEIRILCSHCPFYAEEDRILHCLANHGIPKIWRYHPEPMNRFEKVSLIVCFCIFGGFPFLAQGYGVWFLADNYADYSSVALLGLIGVAAATLLTSIAFFSAVSAFLCPNCVNFSCPLNRVPKSAVDEYLNRNPVIKKAWEKSGYECDGIASQ